MTDPISDMLTRIRNANRALLADVAIPYSKIKESIAKILKREGFIAECIVEGGPAAKRKIKLKLKYEDRRSVITGLRRISTPGLRRYVASDAIPRVLGGLGVSLVSTSKGVMTGAEARKQNMGGELICFIW